MPSIKLQEAAQQLLDSARALFASNEEQNQKTAPNDTKKQIPIHYYEKVLPELQEILLSIEDSDLSDTSFATQLQEYLARHWQTFKGSALSYTACPNDPLTKLMGEISLVVQKSYNSRQYDLLNLPEKPELNTLETLDMPSDQAYIRVKDNRCNLITLSKPPLTYTQKDRKELVRDKPVFAVFNGKIFFLNSQGAVTPLSCMNKMQHIYAFIGAEKNKRKIEERVTKEFPEKKNEIIAALENNDDDVLISLFKKDEDSPIDTEEDREKEHAIQMTGFIELFPEENNRINAELMEQERILNLFPNEPNKLTKPSKETQQDIENFTKKRYVGGELYFVDKLNHTLKKIDISTENLKDFDQDFDKTTASYTLSEDELVLMDKYVENIHRINAINILMPTVDLSAFEDTMNLSPKDIEDIQQIFKTHILSNDNSSLISLQRFIDLNSTDIATQTKSNQGLSAETKERLKQHSADTLALSDASEQYELSLKEQGSLLSHLRQLCKFMKINSKEGVGEEENAGAGVYAAIIEFNDYYTKLDEESKNKIPQEVRDEINTILTLSGDAEKNIDATKNIQTCTATRREKLEKAIEKHEKELESIGISKAQQASLSQKHKDNVTHCQKTLATAMTQRSYQGYDKLDFSKQLFDILEIPLSIASSDDLRIFTRFSPGAIRDFCQDRSIQQQLINQLKNIEDLILFAIDTQQSKLESILSFVGEDLAQRVLKKPKDMAALLISLDKERCQIICREMQSHLFNLIKNSENLRDMLEHLNPEQRTTIFELMEKNNRLPRIATSSDLRNVLQYFNEEQRTKILGLITPLAHFRSQLRSSVSFKDVMEYINDKQREDVFQLMQKEGRLSAMVKQSSDLPNVLQYLNEKQREEFFNDALFKRILPKIRHSADFKYVLRYLDEGNREKIFAAKANELGKMIFRSDDLQNILQYLNVDQCTAVLKKIQGNLPKIITHSYDLRNVLEYLNEQQRGKIFESVFKTLTTMIVNNENLRDTLQYLNAEQCTAVLKMKKDDLPKIIKTSKDLMSILENLSAEQQNTIIQMIDKDHLREMLKKNYDLKNVLQHLNIAHYAPLLQQQKEQLPKIIRHVDDLKNMLKDLRPEQSTVFLREIKDYLPQIILNSDDFLALLQRRGSESRDAIFDSLRDTALFQVIKDLNTLNKLCAFFPEQGNRVILDAMENKNLLPLIEKAKNFNELKIILAPLKPEQRVEIYHTNKEFLQKNDHLEYTSDNLEQDILVNTQYPELKKEVENTKINLLDERINNIEESIAAIEGEIKKIERAQEDNLKNKKPLLNQYFFNVLPLKKLKEQMTNLVDQLANYTSITETVFQTTYNEQIAKKNAIISKINTMDQKVDHLMAIWQKKNEQSIQKCANIKNEWQAHKSRHTVEEKEESKKTSPDFG